MMSARCRLSGVASFEAAPCRVSFERGSERHVSLMAVVDGAAGWLLLLEASAAGLRAEVSAVTAAGAGERDRLGVKAGGTQAGTSERRREAGQGSQSSPAVERKRVVVRVMAPLAGSQVGEHSAPNTCWQAVR